MIKLLRTLILPALLFLFGSQSLFSQAFTEQTTISLYGISNGSVAWGDYDNDGDQDILLTGNGLSLIYRNDAGAFVDIGAGLTGVNSSSAAWGDYDKDGDLDILLTGESSGFFISVVYRNDNGVFVNINAGLPGVTQGSAAWGDYDSDGDLDIFLTGYSAGNYISVVYRNDNGTFVDINAGLISVSMSSAAWGDYDNDGDLDILLSGYNDISGPTTKLYRNDNSIFTDFNAGLEQAYYGSVAWGDYDSDGDLDILLAG
jgi:predicted nucleotidyltransferase